MFGYPRIGEKRQLKYALVPYWHRSLEQEGLLSVGEKFATNEGHRMMTSKE
ncbi:MULTISPECIES: hypothetical protein [unclassified Vibrio]|uniref:Cobalamin-independent methionine synthase MetE N-terminal domain-containing protein n=1 Tax=Vibrio sp. HB236076 TaxID=3232307 RepID=A0AB39H9J7_9VIBR|nr:hypothetical protein [Vibrio sp. HB161653]MDP5253555.1 hypothetical protein [Vibrio sp. HB161653]